MDIICNLFEKKYYLCLNNKLKKKMDATITIKISKKMQKEIILLAKKRGYVRSNFYIKLMEQGLETNKRETDESNK